MWYNTQMILHKRLLSLGLVIVLGASSVICVNAQTENNNSLKEQSVLATHLLEDVLQVSYDKTVEAVKKEIVSKGYDYDLSMTSLYDKGNPYSQTDYIGLIAAYTTVLNYMGDAKIYDCKFLTPYYEEKVLEEKVPVKVSTYEEQPDGTFKKLGSRYIKQEEEIPVYVETEKGVYVEQGKETIVPETKETLYADITLTPVTPEGVLYYFDMDYEKYANEVAARINKIKNSSITSDGLLQNVFIQTVQNVEMDDETKTYIEKLPESLTDNQLSLINTAISLIGKVPYEWGGKSTKAGYDATWWTFDATGRQKGLDCSGFVQWVFRTSGFPETLWSSLTSTSTMLDQLPVIDKSEMQIGDLGLLNNGNEVNHVGIYLGNGYYIHCSSSANTVTISKFDFKVFRHAEIEKVRTSPVETATRKSYSLSDNDFFLLSQTVSHEAKGEGLNGWVAVTEVVLNRMDSDLFPNTVSDIVYQGNQFENSSEIAAEEPTQDIQNVVKMVADGEISVLDNEEVLYFRNAREFKNEDWGTHALYTSINNHTFYVQ